MTEYPITTPPELVEQWRTAPEYASSTEKLTMVSMTTRRLLEIATQAARWGADQELAACCALALTDPCCGTKFQRSNLVKNIRNRRRPKSLSLKEQALVILDDLQSINATHYNILRNALEQLND